MMFVKYLNQVKSIITKLKKEKIDVEIETFIHGAMCVSVSGRCFMSQELFGKSANRGECIQPCRRDYLVKDEEGKELKLKNNIIFDNHKKKDFHLFPYLVSLYSKHHILNPFRFL